MDAETQERIQKTVVEILETADKQEMTEFKVRKSAAERLNLDLTVPDRKKFVRQVVESFLQEQHAKAAQQNDAVVEDEEEEEEEEEDSKKRRSDGKQYDDDGDLIICQLSKTRRVTIQDFKGKTLVSIREFYKKDGKFLPTSKGISLTEEQWANFSKNVPAIEEAIENMESRLY